MLRLPQRTKTYRDLRYIADIKVAHMHKAEIDPNGIVIRPDATD